MTKYVLSVAVNPFQASSQMNTLRKYKVGKVTNKTEKWKGTSVILAVNGSNHFWWVGVFVCVSYNFSAH